MVCSIYLLSSSSAFLTLVISIPIYIFVKLKNRKRRQWILYFVITTVTLGTIVASNEKVRIILDNAKEGKLKKVLSNDVRTYIWKASFNVIKSHPIIGVGTGDVRVELMKEYNIIGKEDLIIHKYNAHNQFLETAIEGGIISLMVLLMILFTLFYFAFKSQNLLLIQFSIIVVVFFIFESILYRLAGITFFSLISFLLLIKPKNGHKDF
ncbi:MAG: O-antigen ligase family protein [Bacteroidetes bacterium]|nr:O-antigen ligase family protein [Bacteroidota bacterium]